VRLYRRVGAVIALIRFNYRRGFPVRAQYAPHNIPVRTNIVSQLIALDSTIPKEPPLRKNCFQTTEFVFENDMYDYGCVNRALGSFRLVLTYRQARSFGIRRIYFVILTVLAMSPTAFGQAKFVRLADSASSANRSPRTSSVLAGFTDQNTECPDFVISLANTRSGRYSNSPSR